jgi:DNA polymerase-1
MTKTKTTLLIDGDILLYQEAASVEVAFDWGDDIWSLTADASLAKQAVDVWIAQHKELLNADDVIITLTSPNNWRKDVLPTYKYNRKGKRKPVVFPALRDYCRETYRVIDYDTLEADDVMGILATGGIKKIKGDKIIVSEDKDMKTIPGYLYNPNRPEEGIQCLSKKQADLNHLSQALTGDSTDGYSGCPGVGPKTAEKILKRGTWEEVLGAYTKAGLTETDALVQARVSRILRKGEFSANTGKVKLWNPV